MQAWTEAARGGAAMKDVEEARDSKAARPRENTPRELERREERFPAT